LDILYFIINFFLYLGFLALGFMLLYLVILGLWSISNKKTVIANTDKNFAVLIAVYNEAETINNLLLSLSEISYQKQKLNIIFVADHCTDNTVTIIRESGFKVIEKNDGNPGKNYAVSFGIKNLITNGALKYDALVIFDADNYIDVNYFQVMSSKLQQVELILQGNTGIKNKDDTIFTKLNYINYAITNRLKEHARTQAGLTCRLRGHGTVFPFSIIDELSWDQDTLVEDQAMLLDLILKGKRVVWVHDAIVDSVIPSTAQESVNQRRRWAGGKSGMTGMAIKSLFRYALQKKSIISFDLMVDYIMPSFSLLIALSGFGAIVSFIVFGATEQITVAYGLLILGWITYYLFGALLEKVPMATFIVFFLSPFFILWRVWIFATSITGAKKW